jgi:excinuclease ABC subunit B
MPAAMKRFRLSTPHQPCGDQPEAISALLEGLEREELHQVLLGVTGSGKTFTVANVIEHIGWPTLVIAPNKTLAAQLYGELKGLFPDNAVEYFVSYYDYYQPEAYVPSTNTFIEKDASINDEIDRLRHSATRSLLSRRDVIIVASVSCIYGIGSAEAYYGLLVQIEVGDTIDRDEFLRRLVDIQYKRNDFDFHRGTFRVRGDIVEVFPVAEEALALRISFFGDDIEAIEAIDPLRGTVLYETDKAAIFPASHYVTFEENRKQAVKSIKAELVDRLGELVQEDKWVEEQRLRERTHYDLEMLQQMGYCSGIENYSRHLTGRAAGEPPPTLVDYFPKPFLCILDESHVTLPQLRAMYRGDQSRKSTLVEHGFRLPSAMDNRPLRFEEWLERMHSIIHVSATPGDWEVEQTEGIVVEQVVRPTGLLDPEVDVRSAEGQVDDLLAEIRVRVDRHERVLVTTLTKRMAENLTEYFTEVGVRVRYLHSDVDTLERVAIIRDLRLGKFDVLVGINLLREGLDIPEVSLVAILDADKEGFLRSRRSLVQTMGRASRNAGGQVILYADRVTDSMRAALDETGRRREKQTIHNEEHGIVPTTIVKPVFEMNIPPAEGESKKSRKPDDIPGHIDAQILKPKDIRKQIKSLQNKMWALARDEKFEEAAEVRDTLNEWEQLELEVT